MSYCGCVSDRKNSSRVDHLTAIFLTEHKWFTTDIWIFYAYIFSVGETNEFGTWYNLNDIIYQINKGIDKRYAWVKETP